jgi:hypothetical protein
MSLPNHDELKELFESNPEKFEIERKRLLDEHINSQSDKSQASLRSYQDSINSRV